MEHHHFDVLTRVLVTGLSRHTLVRTFTGGLLALVTRPLNVSTVAARKKHRQKRKKPQHRQEQHEPAVTPSPPPPADPVTTADATCQLPWWGSLAGQRRYAQTFLAQRSGQMTSSSVGLTYNEEGLDFELAVREIDPEGRPGYVLARSIISNVPATNVGVPPVESIPVWAVTGVFATPATVVAGQVYALTLTGDSRYTFTIQAASDNPCSDGELFTDRDADGAFHAQGAWDFAYSTFVTA